MNSPLGYTKIVGDSNGMSSVIVLNSKEKITNIVPLVLEDCAIELKAYFARERKQFDLKLNPRGTDFQKRYGTNFLKFLTEKRFHI